MWGSSIGIRANFHVHVVLRKEICALTLPIILSVEHLHVELKEKENKYIFFFMVKTHKIP